MRHHDTNFETVDSADIVDPGSVQGKDEVRLSIGPSPSRMHPNEYAELKQIIKQQGLLDKVLNCDGGALPDVLERYAGAALQEYVSFFLGRRVFTRGGDFLEYWLFLVRGCADRRVANMSN
jgi:hypothetical protein